MGSRRTIKMRGFMLLILLGYVASCAAITCKDGETEHSGKCYKLYTEKKNFNDAKATCKGATGGGDLISVDSAEMQQFVMIQMKETVDEIWLGAKVNKTDWRWVKSGANLKYQGCFSDNNNARLVNSGSSKPDNTPDSCIAECRENNRKYAGVKRDGDNVVCRCGDQYSTDGMQSNGCEDVCPKNASQKCGKSGVLRIYSVDSAGANGWFSKQPNNYDGYQPCLALHRDNPSTGYPYKFADEKCHKDGEKYGYLCEYDSQQSGCTMHQGRCYSQHSTSLSWFKARAECMKNGGNLLQVDTQKLFEHFISDSANLDKSVQRWWIGGSNELWQWPSGNELMYQNWASNEPSSASDECAIIGQNVGKGYEWDDKSCSDQFGFMCQTGEVATTTMPTTPSTEATTPSTKATTPSTKATTPSTKATTPSTKATTPSTKATTPSTKATTPSTKTTTPSTKATTPSTKATTPSTKATAPSTKPTVPTAKPTPAKATTADTNTWEENGNVTTTATPVNPSEQKDKKKIFTTGVIVAIAVAAVFVLLAFIRVMIYCCSSSASADSKPFAE